VERIGVVRVWDWGCVRPHMEGQKCWQMPELGDADNQLAIQEICTRNGETVPLEQLAEQVLVEQHKDNPHKAHIYVLSNKPFPIKASDKGKSDTGNKIETNEIPAIEVKNVGGLSYAWNSMHEDGCRYEFVKEIEQENLLDDFPKHIDSICKKYGLEYLDENGNGKGDIPIAELFKPDTKIYKGNNRHKEVLRVSDSLISRNRSILPLEKIKQLAMECNQRLCDPPLDEKEFDGLFKQALGFISRNDEKTVDEEKKSIVEAQGEEAELASKIPDRDYAEYLIETIKQTVKQEDSLVRQIVYTAISKDTRDPINLAVIAPTSEGKTYAVHQTLQYFPKQDIMMIGSMSPRVTWSLQS